MKKLQFLVMALVLSACDGQATAPQAQKTEGIFVLIENGGTIAEEDQAETLPGKIAAALYNLRNDVRNGILPVESLRQKLKEKPKIDRSPQIIGRELTAMGIKRRKSMGIMHIIWDQENIEKLWERYGVLQ